MDMKENQKLDLASSYDDRVSEDKTSTQKISILDHTNGFQYTTTDKSDSFVIDMESFSHGVFNKEMNPNPRNTKKLQRSLSRKGSAGDNKKTIDRDSFVSSSSPKGSCMPEKPTLVVSGTTQVHHQITNTTGNISAAAESRFNTKRNSCRRPPLPWLLDPKRILMLCFLCHGCGGDIEGRK